MDAADVDDAPAGLNPQAIRAYLEARTLGLCHEGALEIAQDAHGKAMTDTARIETVEFKLAHLERALQELSDVVYRQQQQLDTVHAASQRLLQQLEALDDRGASATAEEKPPHY